jgi:hypothetical protein
LHVVLDPDDGEAHVAFDAQDEARKILGLVAVQACRGRS